MSRPSVSTDVLNEIGWKLFQIKATVECAKNNLFEVCTDLDDPPEPQQAYLCLCLLLPQFNELVAFIQEQEREALQRRRNKDNGGM